MIYNKQTSITEKVRQLLRLTCLSQAIKKKALMLVLVGSTLSSVTPNLLFSQQSKIDSLFEILKHSKPDTNKVKALYFLSQVLNETKPDTGLIYAKQGLELAQQLKFKKGQSISLNALALSYYQMGNFDSAMINFEKRFTIVSDLRDSIGIAGAYDNMGVIYLHRGNINKALELREKANRIYATHNKKTLLANGYVWIGNIYKEQGEYPVALDNYLQALKIFESKNDIQNIALSLINISSIYRYLNQYSQAKKYAVEAKKIFEETKNDRGLGISLYRLALILNEEKDFDNSIHYLFEAKKIFEKIENLYFGTLVNLQLGNCYHSKGLNDLALNYLNIALNHANKIGDKNLLASVLENIGTVYYERHNYKKALSYIKKSEKIFNEINDRQTLRNLAPNLIDIYSRLNKPDSVIFYFYEYQQLSDSLYNKQNSKSIAEIQTKYETAKKDKEILTLKLDAQKRKNTIWFISSGFGFLLVLSGAGFWFFSNRKKRERTILQQQITEHDMKALRSQMNPHFIFNCVDSIERLLDEAKITESKNSLIKFSKLTRIVLENSTKREIPLSDEIETTRLYMDLGNMRFKKPFTYNIAIDTNITTSTTLIPPLIIQPFVENSIKHGFRDPANDRRLKIEIRKENEFLVCIVEDNGIGRSESMNVKSLSGFKKESFGLKLTEERLRTISKIKKTESHFLIDDLFDSNNKPLGTRVKIFLPFEQSI